MDPRLAALGSSIMMIAAGFVLYGLLVGSSPIVGVGLSTLVLGATITVVGITYEDPLTEALRNYGMLLASPLVKTLEDLGLANNGLIQVCRAGAKVYTIITDREVSCSQVTSPGFGIIGNSPYVAFEYKGHASGREDLEGFLAELGLSRIVDVRRGEDTVVVELRDLRREIASDEWRPLNIYELLVPASASMILGENLIVDGVEREADYLRISLRVIGE